MNPEEARLILQCRRPQGQDDHLPAMTEARRALEHLPEQCAALEADATLDALICEKMRDLTPPADLRRAILTGAHLTPRLPWWRGRNLLLAAAALVVLGAASLFLKPGIQSRGPEITQVNPAPSLSDFREDTTAKVNQSKIALAKVSPKINELQDYLTSHSKGQRVPLPAGLTPLPTHGCEVFQWKGREVTLICFETAEAGTAHLFTISAADLPANLAEPLLATANGWETLTWKQDGKVLQLIARTTPENLRRLVLPG